MKQIPLLSDRFLVVEMDKFTDFDCPMEIHGNKLVSSQSNGLVINTTKLPPGNWQVIGMLSEVTEEQAKKVVDYFTTDEDLGKEDVFRDYKGETFYDTALESLESAILAEGYCIDSNPYGFPTETEYEGKVWRDEVIEADIKAYNEAQSRVLDRSRCLLLGREDT